MFTIYEIKMKSKVIYVGMTTQPLQRRLQQHLRDSKGGCSIPSKQNVNKSNLCQKKRPKDLKHLHATNANFNDITIHKITTHPGPYADAKKVENIYKTKNEIFYQKN